MLHRFCGAIQGSGEERKVSGKQSYYATISAYTRTEHVEDDEEAVGYPFLDELEGPHRVSRTKLKATSKATPTQTRREGLLKLRFREGKAHARGGFERADGAWETPQVLGG
jgi:hypothetical protein